MSTEMKIVVVRVGEGKGDVPGKEVDGDTGDKVSV
jgi:hypothetical protein